MFVFFYKIFTAQSMCKRAIFNITFQQSFAQSDIKNSKHGAITDPKNLTLDIMRCIARNIYGQAR
jgi:hypothetical protein